MKPKFEIGDEVIFTKSKNQTVKFSMDKFLRKDKNKIEYELMKLEPRIFYVTDIKVDICYGGCQIHYNLRGLTHKSPLISDVDQNIILCREFEIEKYKKEEK